MSDTIGQICKALSGYYKSLDKPYDELFFNYCEDNGLDEETILEELQQDATDCLLIDFDEDFPFEKEPKNKQQAIFDMIRKCYENPGISFETKFPTFDQDLFDIKPQDLEEIKKVYQEQCPVLWNSGMSTDSGFLQILAVARKNNFDYLLHLVDDYSRDRVKNINQPNGWQERDWLQNHKHFKRLKNLKVNVPHQKQGDKNAKVIMKATPCDEVAMGAVISFGKRCTPKLLFSNMMSINDSLEMTVQFINSCINFISNLAGSGRLICPFQIDMCIAVGAPTVSENNVTGGGDSDDDDDDDDDDDTGGGDIDDGLSGDFVDCIGGIEDKLKNNNLKYKFKTAPQARMFDVYKEFVEEHKLQNKDDKTEYLHKKRIIALVDRREEKNDEKCNIFMYEPPKDCRDMPKKMAPEWCISASRTCLLPNMDYKEETAITDDEKKKDDKTDKEAKEDNVTKLKNSNIGASFHVKGGLITFSYYVKAQDVIKCYMYWNGQVIRFMPQDIKTVLPKLFNMDYEENKSYIEDKKGELEKLIEEMKGKLVDKEFAAFQQSYL